ncbi:ATP-grasp domain-containing protein [Burkholderia ubonensis]|uniref:ATP-grasp domain-containing protein n=1 Tax=Burkholderia ubonensis TaxID=101571 RepID=UPI000BA6BF5B|nr:ATP-grasp domain-containing protein [Burkholderia ubonensis]PAJ86383.1 carboxylate--amine ligase [Burkholderia ubonensis]PAJ93397.1 carboxylate--amine ligase [Burkholderia ubonensis]PAK06388.1 carboxylate--amine ligase [Burkholderia ubonensis]PAK12176.1 carboxylate--amine ligase [Burkholderia ubonensis]RQP31429.1 ATP-grasp domain-containing protein [Burkholderia ubonensis]
MKLLAIEVSQFGSYFEPRYERIEQDGSEVYVLSGNAESDHWKEGRLCVAGSKSFEDLIEAAKSLHVAQRFDGVFTFAESSVIAAAAIAEALDLPSIGVDAATRCRNKYYMRQEHARLGAPHPAFALVPTLDAALSAASQIGYPVILKPTLGAGSQFVYKIHDAEELQTLYPKALNGIQSMSHIANEGQPETRGPHSLLLEGFLDGREFLIEAYIWDGETVLGSIVDRVTLEGNHFDDDVHHAPTDLTPEQIKQVHDAVHQGAVAQGLRRSVMHAEIRFHEGKPYILEIAARPGGGGLDFMARLSAGYCPLRATIDIARGKRPEHSAYAPTSKDTFALCLIPDEGEIASIAVPQEILDDPSVFLLKMVVSAGSTIRRPPNGNDIGGFLGVYGAGRNETEIKAKRYAAAIAFEMK